MSDVAQLMRAANPVPDADAALTDDEFHALLLLTQTRSGTMDVQQLTKPIDPGKKQRSGWLVAAVAFAVVIVFVGAAILLARPAAELPPVTTPTTQAVTPTTEAAPPTTQAAPPTTVAPVEEAATDVLSVEQQEFVDTFMAAFNSGDDEAFLALFAPDAFVWTLYSPSKGLAELRQELSFRRAMNQQWTSVSCSTDVDVVKCQIEIEGDDLTGLDGPLERGMRLTMADGAVTYFAFNGSSPQSVKAWRPFFLWLLDNHPDDVKTMTNITLPYNPRVTDESINLWLEYLPEYKATLDG